MNGPHPLSQLASTIEPGSVGACILSRDGKHAHYVGRSDSDLRARISASAREGSYTHFWFNYESSPMNAYHRECRWWHQYSPPDNFVHPAVPAGTFWRCPVAGCGWA